jgi:flagellar FliJ protein
MIVLVMVSVTFAILSVNVSMALAQIEIDRILLEEAGARDALALAFEEQKKYEQVAEAHRLDRLKTANRIESAAMDEMGLRRTMRS